MGLPLDIRDLLKSGTRLRDEREQHTRIAVYIDAEAPDEAVSALKSALHPQMSTARLHIEALVPGDVLVVDDSADAVIALAGDGTTLAPSLARARDRFIPTVVLALGAHRDVAARRLEHPVLDTLVGESGEDLVRALGHWLTDRVGGKRLALAANFAFVRRAVAEESVKATAFQNGVIGGVAIIPGADMPLMTANQAKMVLQIAAAYGEPLGAERIRELAAVIGGAYAFRTVARQAATLIPGFGWALKAGIGYSGTLAMGYAAIDFFEHGGDVRGLPDRLRSVRDKAVDTARHRIRRPIPADGYVVSAPEVEQVVPASLPPAPLPRGSVIPPNEGLERL